MNKVRSTIVLAACAAMTVASCSVSTDNNASSSTAATTTTAAAETTAAPESSTATTAADTTPSTEDATPVVTVPARGVTEDTIKLGVALIDVDAVKAQFGVDLGTFPEGAPEALAEAINARGGINGKMVEVVVRKFLPVGTESSEQACRELIEDEEVYAVLGAFLGDGGLCVTETYSTPYFAAFGLNEERQERSLAPFLSVEGDTLRASIQKVVDTGIFDGKKVAVYYESDATQTLIDDKVISTLTDGGVDVVSQGQLPATGGDLVQGANDIDVLFQKFQADGADALLSVSGATILLPALERTSWQPQLVFTNGQFTGDGGLDNFGLTDFSELVGSIGVSGSLLSQDLVDDEQFNQCLTDINAGLGSDYTTDDIFDPEVKPNSRSLGTLPAVCQLWFMALTVLERVGDNLAPELLEPALDDVGSFSLPGYPDAEITSTRWGAVESVRLWHFDEAERKFLPDGD